MKGIRKYHRWLGIVMIFFLIMFAWSGIVLNHRKAFSEIDVSRNILPKDYHYENWNNGAIKGSVKLTADSILLYGNSGIWLTDSLNTKFSQFTNGFAKGADNRIISRIVKTEAGQVFSVATFDLYQLDEDNIWQSKTKLLGIDERIADMEMRGDTVVVLSRSNVYYSISPYTSFTRIELTKPDDYVAETSLFRTLWLLHSGELFGMAGKITVDFLGALLIVLSVTGIIYFISPKILKRKKKQNNRKRLVDLMRSSLSWHNKVGRVFIVLFIALVLSGMFLRPPLLITIITSKISNIPYTILDDSNVWHDKLRTIRYDRHRNVWMLYTSSGFYSLNELSSIPQKIKQAPPVSVMGVNVMEPMNKNWIVGSFSGMFLWNPDTGESIDCFTGKPAIKQTGRPFSTTPVSGYSGDFSRPVIFEYGIGAYSFDGNSKFILMPDDVKKCRMSLWHMALEVHTGRIYSPLIGGLSDVFLLVSGSVTIFILISGYVIYRKRHRRKSDKRE